MTRVIGVLNAGSSSVKFSVFAVAGSDLRPLFRGEFEGIGTAPHFFATEGGARVADAHFSEEEVATQEVAVLRIFDWLKGCGAGLEMMAVGHRVVHGGPVYSEPVVVDERVLEVLTGFEPLAPAHQPHNLAPIRALSRYRPGLTQVACFDTAFHRTAPLVADVYALPREYLDAGVRRYGFHGLSFEYVSHALRALDPVAAAGRVVIRPPGQRMQHGGRPGGQEPRQHDGPHGAGRPLYGHAVRPDRPWRSHLPDAATGHVARPGGGPALQPLWPQGIVRRLQRHARPAGQRPTGRPARGRLLRRPHRPRTRLARRGPERAGRAGVHRRHRRARRRDPRAGLPRRGLAGRRARRRGQPPGWTSSLPGRAFPLGLGHPDQRRTDDRPAHPPAPRRRVSLPEERRGRTMIAQLDRPLEGRKGLVVGIANDHSIAYGCARAFRALGAELAVTYLNDKARPYVEPLAQELQAPIFLPCDVQDDAQVDALSAALRERWGRLDFALHAVAFAPKPDLQGRLTDSSREGFLTAMDISCHSFIRLARRAEPLMTDGGTLLTLSFAGAERVVQNYDLMGPVKAALECAVRYLAYELGPKGIRVHALSPGPIHTRAASGLKDFDTIILEEQRKTPLGRLAELDDVGAMPP